MNGVAEPEPRKKFLGLSCITMRLRWLWRCVFRSSC
jgi:hypothetical protein